MSDRQDRVMELLEQWSETIAQGREVSATELCAAEPEMLAEVEHHLRFLRALDRLAVADTGPENAGLLTGTSIPVPTIPNHDILGLLGQGGMGAVYLARDRRLGRIVALKVIKEGQADRAHLDRFAVEAEAAARLNHPHVVQVYEVGRWQSAEGVALPRPPFEGKSTVDTLYRVIADAPTPPRLCTKKKKDTSRKGAKTQRREGKTR